MEGGGRIDFGHEMQRKDLALNDELRIVVEVVDMYLACSRFGWYVFKGTFALESVLYVRMLAARRSVMNTLECCSMQKRCSPMGI